MKKSEQPATKGDVTEAIEELAQMTHRSFVYMQDNMATKDDLNEVKMDVAEVKDDLAEVKNKLEILESKMATKDDLKAFATKQDLKAFATKQDFYQLEDRMDVKFDKLIERFDAALNTFSEAIHALIVSQEKMNNRLQAVEQKVFDR